MKPCINEATTMNTDFETDMRAYAAAGFQSVELWLDKVQPYAAEHGVDAARRLLDETGITPVCACAQAGIMLSEGEDRQKVFVEFQARLELCQALQVPKVITFAGRAAKPTPETYQRVVDNVREGADLAAQYGVTLGLEFIKGHGVIGCMATVADLVRQVDRPNVGVLFDFFHFYAGISKLADLAALTPEELAFVHVNDAPGLPREMLTDAHRVWLGQGTFPLQEFRAQLQRLGYEDGVSLELFDRELWERDPYQVAKDAYRNVVDFIEGKL